MRVLATAADLEKLINENKGRLIVVDFFAQWCGPCRNIAPKVEALAKEIPEVEFAKVDVDQNEEAAAKYSVTAMPTFVFIKDGKEVDRFSGANETKLRETITRHK
uniref:Thioredoxin n=1 Tax=Fasciola hepatica TaxID=6192 RepID=Q9U1G7_FASHE|nr:Chain A, THIOREDOXIN [Fasciola hepatica]CAB65014.1 thioredoxin (TRX) [Fasciola hepatica]